MAQPPSSTGPHTVRDPLNHFARNIIDDYQTNHDPIYRTLGEPAHVPPPPGCEKVAVIGAGIGGLYAAYLLQMLKIPYTIYEASERAGGRLYTFNFSQPNSSQWDYVDMGAMRFPETPIMEQLFRLFDDLGLKKLDFHFEDRHANSTLLYNNILRKRDDSAAVAASGFQFPGVEGQPWGSLGVRANMLNVTKPFRSVLKCDAVTGGNDGWRLMMQYDIWSTRAYMQGQRSDWRPDLDRRNLMPYPVMVVNWCETVGHSTSSFDAALTETVLESLAFEYEDDPETEVKWYCIEHGSSQIAKKLLSRLEQTADEQPDAPHELEMETPVTALRSHHDSNGQHMTVHTADGGVAQFGHVITATTLPCLRAMDLSRAELDNWQGMAVRSLTYTSAVKVGVQFASAWWQDDVLMKKFGAFGKIVGGQSFTDRLIRRVVYPSYGADDCPPSTVLMACYAADADARPWEALARPEAAAALKRTIINDLVDVHGFNDDGRRFLEDAWQNAAIHHWAQDPYTLGSWGFFYPGQFRMLYSALTRPAAGGILHFAGEGVSARHGWVIGALEASKRAVWEVLRLSYPNKLSEFEERCGMPEAWTPKLLSQQLSISEHHWKMEFPVPVE